MHLSDTDLKQLDADRLARLTRPQKEALLVRLLEDLKEARERLRTNSQNSSKPPSSDPPWKSVEVGQGSADQAPDSPESENSQPKGPDESGKRSEEQPGVAKKAGRRPGSEGHSRREILPVTETIQHRPRVCTVCGLELDVGEFRAETGLYIVDIEQREQQEGLLGLVVRHAKHVYGSIACSCGHVNHTEPGRCEDEPLWTVALSDWCLVGPMLASLLVCLSQRMRLSRRLIREFLQDWFGLTLSTSLINRCIHEAGRAVEPLEEQLVDELQQEILAHVDETPWKEWGQLLWLWVISTATVCLYLIGSRSTELLNQVFGENHRHWLMSDGYAVYRRFRKRLRCWAHLLRKAKFLEECLSVPAQKFGQECRILLETLMDAVYQAREGPPVDLTLCYAGQLEAFRQSCERYRQASHAQTRALAREFLNDWDAIFRVLAHPFLPFTNNEAERALRHWVIVRRITQGTRTAQGTRAVSLLASVIETCRKRNILPWPYLAAVIAERRKGKTAPAVPAPACA